MGVGITPYAAGQFTTYRLPSYAEQATAGANTFALSYNGKDVTATRTELGLRSEKAVALIKRVEDPFVANIVKGWAGRYDAKLAGSMGFKAEKNFDEIIKVYQDDEMRR